MVKVPKPIPCECGLKMNPVMSCRGTKLEKFVGHFVFRCGRIKKP